MGASSQFTQMAEVEHKEGGDLLGQQIELRNDRIVDKILYYFSTDEIPCQFLQDFNKTRLISLVQYETFNLYLDNLWMKTGQMQSINVVNSSKLPQGMLHMPSEMSYLDEDFI